MYDESEAKAGTYEEAGVARSPLQTAMAGLDEGIGVVDALSEKLGESLMMVLRESVPTESADSAKRLEAVDLTSEHVRHVLAMQLRLSAVAGRLRSLLERVEV